MTGRIVAAAALSLALAACESENPRQKALQKISHDEELIKKASGAVSEVIRNAADCEAAKPLIPEAAQRIEEARKQVTVPASQSTLDALKVQLDRVASVCP